MNLHNNSRLETFNTQQIAIRKCWCYSEEDKFEEAVRSMPHKRQLKRRYFLDIAMPQKHFMSPTFSLNDWRIN